VHLLRNAVDHGIEPPDERVAAGKRRWTDRDRGAPREGHDPALGLRRTAPGSTSMRCARAVRRASCTGSRCGSLPEQIAALRVRAGPLDRGEVSRSRARRRHGRGALDARVARRLGRDPTERGRGTTTTLVVPITAAVQRVLMLGVGAEIVAVPIAKVERIEECPPSGSSAPAPTRSR
jgi:two-component system chemotaxis sensor kinase CheA